MAVTIEWNAAALRDHFLNSTELRIALRLEAEDHCKRVNSWTRPWMHGDMRNDPFMVESRTLTNTQVSVIRPRTKAGYGMAVKRGALHW